MLSKLHRLHHKDIQQIYSKRRYFKSSKFVAYFDYSSPNTSKFAFVIAKKYGEAHDRNKLRRQLRSIISNSHLLDIPNLRLIIVIKQPSALLEYTKLSAEVNTILNRV